MILIPEIETIVILPPRTASKSISKAVATAYPKSIRLYRHMEADGIPHGYDRWRRVGLVRSPIDRLFSLYKFLREIDSHESDKSLAWRRRVSRAAVTNSFDLWLQQNETVFTDPYDTENAKFWPAYTVLHALPENRKSQWIYLRPDLGTEVYAFSRLDKFVDRLGLTGLPRTHVSSRVEIPAMSSAGHEVIHTFHSWDQEVF